MIPFKIGNWIINENGIDWVGAGTGYRISRERLQEAGTGNRANVYDWLVHLAEKTWLTETDVYALNTAIIYALEYFELGFSPDLSFIKTFIEQQKIISEKE